MRTFGTAATSRRGGLVLAIAILAVSACVRTAAPPPPPPVTPEQARGFAEKLVAAVHTRSVPLVNRLIDRVAILDRAMSGIDAPKTTRDNFRAGFLEANEDPTSLGPTLVGRGDNGDLFRMLRTRSLDGRTTALVCVLTPGTGEVFYEEFVLEDRPGWGVVAVDVNDLNRGDRMSDSLRRGFTQVAARAAPGLRSRFTHADLAYVDNLPAILEMRRLHGEGRDEEALAVFRKLPPAAQDEKPCLLEYYAITQGVGDAEHAAAVERLRARFPKAPFADFLSIDGYLFTKDYNKALAAVDRFDRSIGGDPFLDYHRAAIEFEAGHPRRALKLARAAAEAEPGCEAAWWLVVNGSLAVDDHAATLAALREIDRRFPVDADEFSDDERYARFVRSPEYAEWQTDHARKTARQAPR